MHLRHIHVQVTCCAIFCSVNADVSWCVPDKDITAKYVINAGHTGFGYNVPALRTEKRKGHLCTWLDCKKIMHV